MDQKVKIQYGIFGGERGGGRLRRALRKAGYTTTRNAADADIIVAHSAGCFWLPAASTKQKILLIDPPYWPGRSIADRRRARIRRNFQFRAHAYPTFQWTIHNLWGAYYAVRDFGRTRRIIRYVSSYNLEDTVKDRRALLVRNEHDDWLTPELTTLKQLNKGLKVVELPGDHDDVIYYPERYVELLKTF